MGASFDLSYTVLKGNSGRLSSKVSVGLLPFGTLSQNSDTERRVPELILVLSSQPAGDVSTAVSCHYFLPGLQLVTLATLKRAATNFAAWWTEAQLVWTVCLRLLPDSVAAAIWTQALLKNLRNLKNPVYIFGFLFLLCNCPARKPLVYWATHAWPIRPIITLSFRLLLCGTKLRSQHMNWTELTSSVNGCVAIHVFRTNRALPS